MLTITTTSALSNNRISNHTTKTVSQALAVMIQKAFLLAGQTPGIDDMRVLIHELTTDLTVRYKTMTLSQVQCAIDNGVRNEYGDYFGINVVTINKWLAAYGKNMQRKQAIQTNSTSTRLNSVNLSISQKDELLQQAVDRCYARYCNNGIVCDFGNAVYNYLDSKQQLQLSVDEKETLYHRARCQLIADTRNKLIIEGRMRLNKLLKNLLHNPKSEHQRIISHAKRLALEQHFNQLNQQKQHA